MLKHIKVSAGKTSYSKLLGYSPEKVKRYSCPPPGSAPGKGVVLHLYVRFKSVRPLIEMQHCVLFTET